MIGTRTNRPTRDRTLTLGLLVAALLILTLLATKPAHAATFTVNRTGDESEPLANRGDGVCDVLPSRTGNQCSLRAAIQEANVTAGADLIRFNIVSAASVKTISRTRALPAITKQVTINGYTQSGASANTLATDNDAVLKVQLNGTNAGTSADGLLIKASNSTIKGLVINRFFDNGVQIDGSGATGNKVQGNFLGTTANGNAALANGNDGVDIFNAPNTTVGGTQPAQRNVISGNDLDGVFIFDSSSATNNKVEGNFIGTDVNGTSDLGNGAVGVRVEAPGNFVGGTVAGARNVISGNGAAGVAMLGSGAVGNTVQGNFIGTGANGTTALGNSLEGVLISGAPSNTVGGTVAEAANTVAFNGADGVFISGSAATGNNILRNSIHSNDGLGIDLAGGTENANGATANDPKDPDTGPNNLQNKPALTSFSGLTINGNLNSTPNKTFVIRFFANPQGVNEGKSFLGQKSVTTNANGNVSFTFTAAAAPIGTQNVTATATRAGNTSEFSAPRAAQAP
jgi:CSLREA domain-containing protein